MFLFYLLKNSSGLFLEGGASCCLLGKRIHEFSMENRGKHLIEKWQLLFPRQSLDDFSSSSNQWRV